MRIGELFSGYGGLGMGVQAAMGGDVVWHSDIDAGACKILAHRYPGVPNLGDVTAVDWSAVEPVDVLTGGFPCQDVSTAGRRAGMKPGTRSGLWTHMAHAIDRLRPSLVVIENVRGLLSADAHSDLEPCPWCLGDESDRSALRALGAVLGDLAVLGYDAGWHGIRAADVGAPHGRFRVFVVAHAHGQRWKGPRRAGARGWHESAPPLLPTPTRRDHKGANQRGDDTCLTGALMPTPRATDGTKGGPGQRGSSGDLMLPSAVALLPTPRATRGGSNTETAALLPTPTSQAAKHDADDRGEGTLDDYNLWSIAARLGEAQRLLPTPTSRDWKDGAEVDAVPTNGLLGRAVWPRQEWGQYADAIARWEHVLGRPAPPPTQPSRKGTPQLSPAFSEWLMGLPAGWVTDVPGITRNEALRALGNGVVPQQAAAALRFLLSVQEVPA